MPDDIEVHGFLVDANIELGNFDEAVRHAQWMLNLRPGNQEGEKRAARLRQLWREAHEGGGELGGVR